MPTGFDTSPYDGGLTAVSGGDGLQSSITGSSTYYAGGGGGAARLNYSVPQGIGGLGGGGNGGAYGFDGDSGIANTGGGGGGSSSGIENGTTRRTGGNGGSGVVILRMPTVAYSGATTGSPTVTTDGSDTILTYTGSGTYTA